MPHDPDPLPQSPDPPRLPAELAARLYDHRADPLRLWALAHGRAWIGGTEVIDEFERLVYDRGFPGHRCAAGAVLFGPHRPRVRRRAPRRRAPSLPASHPAHATLLALYESLLEMAAATRPSLF